MSIKHRQRLNNALRATSALFGLATAACLLTQPARALVGNDNYTSSQLVDPVNVTGVGQMVVNLENGYIGLCTATLINPRTVIFASHCVNENPAGNAFEPNTGYGAQFGGLPIGFFFNANNNQAGNSAIGQWLNGIGGGPRNLTRTQNNAYNASYVVYDTNCCTMGLGLNFLQSDIAMAALDTPAVGIPTWTLLFSPLTGPTHATIEGYGIHGTGGTTGGNLGIDYRRRVAENTISVLGSLDDQDLFLFGPPPDGLPQNLYMLDFNDPKFGTAQANAYDFNIFHDAALQKEGITAPGDSGGPLIVDQLFSKSVIAGVLSLGDRFFNGQPSSSYGTTSGYQPLYLFWDWIIANNPYKYVSAKTGDGSWFDPNHWVMNLDPNYVTVVNGQLVNALPTTPAQGSPAEGSVNTPKFGNICFFNDCVDIATGVETIYSSSANITANSPSGNVLSGGPEKVAIADLLGAAYNSSAPSGSSSELTLMKGMFASRGFLQSDIVAPPEGSASVGGEVVQGAPGSSGFVPNDTDGNPATNTPARYYDVTLSAAGTTTLDNGVAIVDRLTINGANTGLTVGAHGGLASLIDTTMYAGNFRVDGLYISLGDIALLGGVLSGNGQVVAPYTTAVLGAIAPGTVGTTGNLSIFGDVVLSSGSGLLIDMSPTAIDRLDVYGALSVGGTAVFTPINGFVPHYHQSGVFATGDTITGTFDHVPDTIPGVLYPAVSIVTVPSGESSYQEALVTFQAASFSSLLTNPTEDQLQIGNALDGARGAHYGDLQALYDAIDPLSDGSLSTALENLAPDNARAIPLVSQLMIQGYTGFVWQHLGDMGTEADGGQTAFHVQTNALQLAQNSSAGSMQTRNWLTGIGQFDTGPASAAIPVSPMPAQASSGAFDLPKGMGGFLSGSSLNGSVAIGGGGGKADVDGFLVAGGVDLPLTDKFRAGVSVALAQASSTLRNTPATTYTNSTQALVYGNYDGSDGWFANGFAGSSAQTIRTHRDVVVGSTTFHLAGKTAGSSPMAGLQAGKIFEEDGIRLAPALGLQYQSSHVSGYTETGGAAAMTIDPYTAEEFDFRIGLDASGSVDVGSTVIKPNLHAFLVNNIGGRNALLTTSFAAAPGSMMSFALATPGTTWAELGLGVQVDLTDCITLGAHYDADVGRSDSRYGAWTGSLRVKF